MVSIIFDFWGNDNKSIQLGPDHQGHKKHEGGRKAEDIVRDLGIRQGTFYKWKQKYGGMEASDVRRLKDLELENSRLKRLLADTILDKEIFKEVIEKKRLGPDERRELVTMILIRFRISLLRALALINLTPSIYYYRRKRDDKPALELIRAYADENPAHGQA